MTDLVARVLLKADGSGLVGQARESKAAIGGVKDAASSAAPALRALGTASGAAEAAVGAMARSEASASTATVALGSAARAAIGDVDQLTRSEAAAAAAATAMASAAGAAIGSTARMAASQVQLGRVQAANTASAGQQRAAYVQLGQQFSDVTTTWSLGISPLVILAQQGGQVAYAFDQMGLSGAGGRLASFFAGPYGAVVLAATVVLGPLISSLFEAGEAAEAAKIGASGLTDAQSVLGDIFDLTTGKIKSQNELLRLNARLTAINLRGEALKQRESSLEAFGNASRSSYMGLGASFQGQFGNEIGASQRTLMAGVRGGQVTTEQALRRTETMDFAGLKNDRAGFQQAIIDAVAADAKAKTADLIDQSLDSNALASELRRPDKRKPKDMSKARAALAEFGRDAMTRIADLGASFGDAPGQIEKVNRALADLDDLVDDIARKKPPGFAQLLADARAARSAIEAGLDKPYRDFLDTQEEALEIQRLIGAGRGSEAEALKIILGLERQMGPLGDARRAAVLGTVDALKAEQRETEKLARGQQKYLDALGEIRTAVMGVVRDPLEGLADLPKRLLSAFGDLSAKVIFDQLFGDAFRELEDQANGTSQVERASARMAGAVDDVSASLGRLGRAADGAVGRVSTSSPDIAGSASQAGGTFFSQLFDGGAAEDVEDIVVTGRPKEKTSPTSFFEQVIGKLAKGVGISEEAAKTIGAIGGKAIKGAAEGALASSVFAPIAKGLGIKTSSVGGQLGGAAGGALASQLGATLGPIAGIAGGLLGSIAGGLLKKTTTGKVTVTSADSDTSATGNSGKARAAATGLAGSLQEGLQQIADQLGGTLGSFSVTVGQRHGDYRVTTGSSLKVAKGAKDFNDDGEAAASYALQLAITQGAIGGLSGAMQKAIRSSSNVDKALREALGVQALEEVLGGLGAKLAAPFRTAEKEAAERLRLAAAYGLDLVKVETLNAERRADVLNQVLNERIGALKQLAADFAYGDLFEGSAAEQRNRVAEEAGKALADAEAGIDGAADRYAELVRSLLEKDKAVYGTAGPELAGDRAVAEANIARVLQLETDRAKAAQDEAKKLSAGVERTNQLGDENNDQNSEMLAVLRRIEGQLGTGVGGSPSAVADLGATSRRAL